MRPRISTNLAISADGKISSVSRIPSGWTSRADHERLIQLREHADAIIVGRGTWENDRMTLTGPRQPLRCIVSKKGHLPSDHPMFATAGGEVHLLVTEEGAEDISAPPSVIVHNMSLERFLIHLSEHHGISNLHCEGGGSLIRSLAELDAIDEFNLTIAGHTLFSGTSAPNPTSSSPEFLPHSSSYRLASFESRTNEGECFLTYVKR